MEVTNAMRGNEYVECVLLLAVPIRTRTQTHIDFGNRLRLKLLISIAFDDGVPVSDAVASLTFITVVGLETKMFPNEKKKKKMTISLFIY